MPQIASIFKSLAVVSLAATFGSSAAMAQGAPADIPGVITVCAPVISEQYSGDKDRWGTCVASVQAFLDAIGTPSAPTDVTVADLVVALTELYQDDLANCRLVETELPQAVALAAQRVTNEEQQAQIVEISATIADCVRFTTAAVVVAASPF